MNIDERTITQFEAKIYRFARKACKEPGRITDMEYNELKKLGLSEIQIIELVAVIGLAASNAIWFECLDLAPADWYTREA